jgi:outer membrane autotransporter protein
MRKSLLLALLGLCGSAASQAQTLKTNILAPVSLYYEQPITEKISVNVGASYDVLTTGVSLTGGTRSGFSSYSIPVDVRFYLGDPDEPNTGFYLGPYIKYRHYGYTLETTSIFTTSTQKNTYSYNALGFGVMAGYQLLITDNLTADFFLGAGYGGIGSYKYTYTDFSGKEQTENLTIPAFTSRLGACIGYRFGDN